MPLDTTSPKGRQQEAPAHRSQPAAVLIDRLNRVLMVSERAIPILRQLFGGTKADDVYGEIPPAFEPKLARLRSELGGSGPSSLIQVTPELCVRGSILKDASREYLLLLFERVSRRNVALHNLQSYGLTPREREVAMAALYGLSNREIANRLSLAEYTVEGYIKRILTKVGVASRAAFVSSILGWSVSGRERDE